MAAVFLVVGNYLPKTRQNYTIGIMIPWTPANEENWNRTHRFAGYLWMSGGIRLCKKLGYAVSETPYYLDDFLEADEVLVTSSSNLCLRAEAVDGKPVGSRASEMYEELREHLIQEFMDATK